jgi:tRNA (mo5U34)-methyltransferase
MQMASDENDPIVAEDDPIVAIARLAGSFKERLADIRARVILPNGLPWYPYVATVENFWVLGQVLKGTDRSLFSNLDGKAVADIGAADGDMAYLLESLGASVDLIDHPNTGNNRMEGAYALKRELRSSVQIHEIDVDDKFVLPRKDYFLVLLLGILYHLKNPYYMLDHLARVTGHLLLSTRIAEFSAPVADPRRVSMAGQLVYLLDAGESNNDTTNYWIFSETSLRLLFRRTGWNLIDMLVVGSDVAQSDPFTVKGDRRAFCYLRSAVYPPPK